MHTYIYSLISIFCFFTAEPGLLCTVSEIILDSLAIVELKTDGLSNHIRLKCTVLVIRTKYFAIFGTFW